MTRPDVDVIHAAFEEATSRALTDESCGLFCFSDAPGPFCGSGAGAFYWFETRQQMLAFIHDILAWWHPAPSSAKPAEIAAAVQEIMRNQGEDDLEALRTHLNAPMRRMWQISWIGTFGGLRTEMVDFARKIREHFRKHYGGSDDTDVAGPIGADDLSEFVECVQEYGY